MAKGVLKSYKGIPLKRIETSIQVSTEYFERKPLYGNNGLRTKRIFGYIIDLPDIPYINNLPMSLSELKYRIDEVEQLINKPRKVYKVLGEYIADLILKK